MDLPDHLKSSILVEKSIFYFSSPKINSSDPHNFIILKNLDNKIIFFTCCTSQYDTVLRYIDKSGNHQNTITSIDYNSYSFLKKPTFINCNSYIEYSKEEFFQLYDNGHVQYRDKISSEEYDSIINGYLLSDDIEEDFKDLFK